MRFNAVNQDVHVSSFESQIHLSTPGPDYNRHIPVELTNMGNQVPGVHIVQTYCSPNVTTSSMIEINAKHQKVVVFLLFFN